MNILNSTNIVSKYLLTLYGLVLQFMYCKYRNKVFSCFTKNVMHFFLLNLTASRVSLFKNYIVLFRMYLQHDLLSLPSFVEERMEVHASLL